MKKVLAALIILVMAASAYAADTKGSALSSTGGVSAANDKLYVMDATPSSKADTVEAVVAAGAAAYFDGSSDAATYIRLYDGNSHYSQFSPGDSCANLTFTFPTAYPAANGYAMLMSTAGVISTSTTPSWQALTLYGENTLSLGTSSSLTGSLLFKNATNNNIFTILLVLQARLLVGREAVSWGKVKENAQYVTVEGDATITLPMLASSILGEGRPGRH